jgi:hypothetical protein
MPMKAGKRAACLLSLLCCMEKTSFFRYFGQSAIKLIFRQLLLYTQSLKKSIFTVILPNFFEVFMSIVHKQKNSFVTYKNTHTFKNIFRLFLFTLLKKKGQRCLLHDIFARF